MAWVLIGGSTNGFLVTNYVNIPASTPYYIKVVGGYDFSSGDAWRVFNDTDSTGDDRLYIGGAGVLIRKFGADTQASWSNPVTDSDQHTHEFISDGTNVEYIFDSVSQGSVVGANNGLSFREYFSRTTSNAEAYLNQLYVEINGVPEINLDSDASDHSGSTDQPKIIDTIGGNDANGVNFSSFDAGVWLDLATATFNPFWAIDSNELIY